MLPTLIRDHVLFAQSTPALFDALLRDCRHLLRNLPDAWLAGCARGAEAEHDLSDRLFFVCDRVPKRRFPFRDRVPFPAYVEEEFDTPPIRHHTFFARLSLARELLREEFARACARDPELGRRAALYAEVGAALRAHAIPLHATSTPTPQNTQARTVWTLPAPSPPAPPLSAAQLLARLRALQSTDVPTLVQATLALLGRASHANLVNLLAELLPPSAHPPGAPVAPQIDERDEIQLVPMSEAPDPFLRLRLREALLAAVSSLSDEDRQLLLRVGRGLPYERVIALNPALKDPPTLCARLKGINEVIRQRLAVALGETPRLSRSPRELAELIYDALLLCLPDLDEEETP